METNEAFSLSEEVPLRLLTLISLILLVPLVMLVSIVQLFELPELELLSFFEQEMMVTLKNIDRERNKIFFIFSQYQTNILLKHRLFYIANLQILKELGGF